MANSLTIYIWVILSGCLAGLFVFFILTSKVKSEKIKGRLKSTLEVILPGVFFVGGSVILTYLILIPKFNSDISVIKFPSTGPGPDTPTLLQCTKSLYATPMDGVISSILLSSILFLVIILFRNIYTKRRIEKDLEDARIVARNVLKDLQAEKDRLAKANATDEALLESIGEGVVAVNQDGKMIIMNKVAEGLLGFTSKDIVGKSFVEAVLIEDAQGKKIFDSQRLKILGQTDTAIPSIITNAITTAPTETYYFIRKDGTKFPAAITATPVLLDAKPTGAIVVFRDITKEKELDQVKTEFISVASHQLRTPVSGLSWLTEALQFDSHNMNLKQKTYVEDLAMLSKRLIGLVEDLLNISRIQLGSELVTEKTTIDMQDFITEFIKEIKPYADSRKHTLVFDTGITEVTAVEINKKSLYNVLQNLVSNAVEYSPEDTEVTINLGKSGEFARISVSNKGPIISKEDQSHLFKRFYRAESAKKIKANGTGLGLYIIKTIIEGAGGAVGIESKKGSDTMFWFTIPLKINHKS